MPPAPQFGDKEEMKSYHCNCCCNDHFTFFFPITPPTRLCLYLPVLHYILIFKTKLIVGFFKKDYKVFFFQVVRYYYTVYFKWSQSPN